MPAERIRVLEALPLMPTKSTGKVIAPFLAIVDSPIEEWKPKPAEVAEVLEIPAESFADPSNLCYSAGGDFFFLVTAKNRRTKYEIRGAAFRILRPIAERLAAMNI